MTERMKRLEALLIEDGKNPFLHFAIAKEYEGMQDVQKALDKYLELKTMAPDYVGLYYHLGKLYEQLGQLDQAQGTYARGMEVAKQQGDKHAHSELSTAHWEISED